MNNSMAVFSRRAYENTAKLLKSERIRINSEIERRWNLFENRATLQELDILVAKFGEMFQADNRAFNFNQFVEMTYPLAAREEKVFDSSGRCIGKQIIPNLNVDYYDYKHGKVTAAIPYSTSDSADSGYNPSEDMRDDQNDGFRDSTKKNFANPSGAYRLLVYAKTI